MNASDDLKESTNGERIRSTAGEGNATTVTGSSTEGISTVEIRELQRPIDAWEKTEKQLKQDDCEKFDAWLRDSTTEVLVEYEGDSLRRIRTHVRYPKVIAVRFLYLRLKHGVGDSVKENRETIRKCLEARGSTREVINDSAASKRIMRHEMLALCDCNVDKISSFHDFERLFENVKTKVEEVLPAVLAVMKEKNEEVKAVLNRRDAVKAFVIEVVEKETDQTADGAFRKLIKSSQMNEWISITNRSGGDKKYQLTAFLEDECEKLETIPDEDDVKKKWVDEMVILLKERLEEARAALKVRKQRPKRGASTPAKGPSIDEHQQFHEKVARLERVTDAIKQACEADAELKDAFNKTGNYNNLGEFLLSVRTKELSKEGISSFVEVSDRACLCWGAIETAIDPRCMQVFEEKRYAIARPFGATAYMPRMLAAMLSNVRVVRAKELLENEAYAKYEKMCSPLGSTLSPFTKRWSLLASRSPVMKQ